MLTSDYELLEEIGRGRFGVVLKAKSRKTNQLFAVKSIEKSSLSGDETDKLSLINEPKALHLLSLSSTSSCHVTRLHSTYDTPSHLHLILDYFPHPSLHDIISHHGPIPEPEARPIINSLLHALMHCHSNGVVHRDIKPENILFDPGSKRVKLIDFGSSGFVECGLSEVVGTPYYVAPEIVEGREYGEKVDTWSVGVVLYVMIAGFPPFYGERIEEVFQKVVRANLRFPFSGVSSSVKDLLRRLICKDVSRRFSAQDALKHPWFETSEEQSETVT